MDESSDKVSSFSLIFSKDSLENCGVFFNEVEEFTAEIVLLNLGVNFFFVEIGVPIVEFILANLAGVGGIDKEANFRFLAENCSKCLGIGGLCIFLARLA